MAELLFLGEEEWNATSDSFYVISLCFHFSLWVQLCWYDITGRKHNMEVQHLEESSWEQHT